MTARVFCAIDTADLDQALNLTHQLSGLPLDFKLGLEFFTAQGISGVEKIRSAAAKAEIFLDLKFHDIPNTVAGAVRSAVKAGPQFLTVHASGGKVMMQAAVDAAAGKTKILAVTVLTHLDEKDLAQSGQSGPVADQVLRLAQLAAEAGVGGVVCSPREIALLRKNFGQDFLHVVPGIRPAQAAPDDQKRTLTPREAIGLGANYLVIGRPITSAPDPAGAAKQILFDIKT